MGFAIGNQLTLGMKRPKHVFDALLRVVAQNPEKLQAACAAVLDKAAEGDLAALDFLVTRLEGKPIQAVHVEDDEGRNVFTGIRMVVMREPNPLITIENTTHDV